MRELRSLYILDSGLEAQRTGMDDDLLLSNTANGGKSASAERPAEPPMVELIAAWEVALADWAHQLLAYASEVGDHTGIRIIGPRWSDSLAAIKLIETTFSQRDAAATRDAAGIVAVMDAGDAGETAEHDLSTLAADVLNPNIKASVLAGMSRTYSGKLKGLARAVLAASAAANLAGSNVLAAASTVNASISTADIAAAYRAVPARGSIATEVYVSALLCRALAGHSDAIAALEIAKSEALGGAADTINAATSDLADLAEYHPLQVMTYTPMVSRVSTTAPLDVLNLTLPQARLAVTYNIAPLTLRSAATAFGKLATTTTGLNYRLVDRLRTITALPLPPQGDAPPTIGTPARAALQPAGAALQFTIDNGNEIREFNPRSAPWLPLAGCQPRVLDYGAASATVILNEIRADRDLGWGLELRDKFEAAVISETIPLGVCGVDPLVSALMAEFGRVYDAEPPIDMVALVHLVIPLDPGPETYIGAACAVLTVAAIADHLKGVVLGVGSRRAPYADIEREAILSQSMRALSLAQDIWRRIRTHFRPDPDVFKTPPSHRRAVMLSAIRKTFIAVAMSGKITPIVCQPPTLKVYAASSV